MWTGQCGEGVEGLPVTASLVMKYEASPVLPTESVAVHITMSKHALGVEATRIEYCPAGMDVLSENTCMVAPRLVQRPLQR